MIVLSITLIIMYNQKYYCMTFKDEVWVTLYFTACLIFMLHVVIIILLCIITCNEP